MRTFLKFVLILAVPIGLFSACQEITRRAEEKVNVLTEKAEQLDSVVRERTDNFTNIDSIIDREKIQKDIDSALKELQTKADSVAAEQLKSLRNL